MKIAIFCCLLAICFRFAVAESVSCDNIRNENSAFNLFSNDITCNMYHTTVIGSLGVSISSSADERVHTLRFHENKKTKFLPVNTAEKFINLVVYDAKDCAIEMITKENFKALSMLKELYLNNNKIEKVPNDAFEDLLSLEVLKLHANKIKFINSAALRGLNKLTYIDLRGNVCVQEWHQSLTSVKSMVQTLTDKCGFIEHNEKLQAMVDKLQFAMAQTEGELKTLQQLMKNVYAENTKSSIKIDEQVKIIATLTTRNEGLSNDLKKENDNLNQCESNKANLDAGLKVANAKLDVFNGNNIGEFKDEVRKEFALLRNKCTCGG